MISSHHTFGITEIIGGDKGLGVVSMGGWRELAFLADIKLHHQTEANERCFTNHVCPIINNIKIYPQNHYFTLVCNIYFMADSNSSDELFVFYVSEVNTCKTREL